MGCRYKKTPRRVMKGRRTVRRDWTGYQNGAGRGRGLIDGRIQSKRVLEVVHRWLPVSGRFWEEFGGPFR